MKQKIFPVFIKISFFVFLAISPVSFVYASPPIKILIVPGHDSITWGGQYGNLKEADMNLAIANQIFNLLKKDERFDVEITRDKDGYVPLFEEYFKNEIEIKDWKNSKKAEHATAVASGEFVKKSGVPHVGVDQRMSTVLYGINKWANEQEMDMVLHIHFNDYPRKTKWTMGKYKGFSIYIPEDQLPNANKSRAVAKNIFEKLETRYRISDFPKENIGLVPDQGLIATGANGTLGEDTRSVLIEYGYIYRFSNYKFRQKFYKNASALTVAGIENHFFPKD